MIRWASPTDPRPIEFIEPTREQEHALEELCLEHGTCRTHMLRDTSVSGPWMHVATEDGTFAILEDGEVR